MHRLIRQERACSGVPRPPEAAEYTEHANKNTGRHTSDDTVDAIPDMISDPVAALDVNRAGGRADRTGSINAAGAPSALNSGMPRSVTASNSLSNTRSWMMRATPMTATPMETICVPRRSVLFKVQSRGMSLDTSNPD